MAKLERLVVSRYHESSDYNGINLSRLASQLRVQPEALVDAIVKLVGLGRVSVVSPNQTNPFIKMFDVPVEEQLDGLVDRDPGLVCLYPTEMSMSAEIDPSAYHDRPFQKMLVLAAPQLEAFPFRLDVLDTYERDPRYWFRFYDFGGTISVHDEHYGDMDESDRINIRFGVGYDDQGNRVVAVYLRHLASLPGKQQRICTEFLVERECRMSEEFFNTSILAQSPDTMSVYEAVIQEQVEVNKLFKLLGRPPLFRSTYEDQRRPRGFSFFVRPTKRQYSDFVLLLDKMLSQNINMEAFGDDVERHERVEIREGEFERHPKGSIAVLSEWLSLRYPQLAAAEKATIIKPLRGVRKERQSPAHSIQVDEYDSKYHGMQDDLVRDVYRGLSMLRRLLMSDSEVQGYEPPFWDSRLTIKVY